MLSASQKCFCYFNVFFEIFRNFIALVLSSFGFEKDVESTCNFPERRSS